MSNDYRGVPIPQTPEQKAQYDKNYKSIFGTRVKIPPPGPEREALIEHVIAWLDNRWKTQFPEEEAKSIVEGMLRAMEEEG